MMKKTRKELKAIASIKDVTNITTKKIGLWLKQSEEDKISQQTQVSALIYFYANLISRMVKKEKQDEFVDLIKESLQYNA